MSKQPKYLGRRTVSRPFRDYVAAQFPGLDGNVAYWRLMERLLFGRETESGGILLSTAILAEIEGKEKQLRGKRYNGEAFLKAFKRDVLPGLEWSEFRYEDGKARETTQLGFDEPFLAALEAERATKPTDIEDRVYFVSGAAFTRKTQMKVREEDRETALARLSEAGCLEAGLLMTYLNKLNSRRFAVAVEKHFDAAWAAAERIEDVVVRARTLDTLAYIQSQPQPFYAPTTNGRTVRLFTTGPSIARLPRVVRKVLTQDWTTVDLKSAQLAIVAKLWDVPVVEAFLRSGQSVWRLLCEAFELEYNEANKNLVKPMLYSLVFGGGTKRGSRDGKRKGGAIWEAAKEAFGADRADEMTERFITVPLIAELLKGREAARLKVEEDGGAWDAFGNWVPLKFEYGRPNARSVLASVAQSYELKILWPVIAAAIEGSQFDIVLYLFDGLSLAFNDNARRETVLADLKAKVDAVAASMGMYTELEY